MGISKICSCSCLTSETPSTEAPKQYKGCCMTTKQALITGLVMALFAAGAGVYHYYGIGAFIAPTILAGACFVTLLISLLIARCRADSKTPQVAEPQKLADVITLYRKHTNFHEFNAALSTQDITTLSHEYKSALFHEILKTSEKPELALEIFKKIHHSLSAETLNAKGEGGKSPLQIALANKHDEIARLLMTNKYVNVMHQDNIQDTPLHTVAEHGNDSHLRAILQREEALKNINAPNAHQQSPVKKLQQRSQSKPEDQLFLAMAQLFANAGGK